MKKLLALLSVFLALPAYAADFLIPQGQTDVCFPIFISDSSSSTGAGLTGVTWDEAGLSCYYYRAEAGSTETSCSLNSSTLGSPPVGSGNSGLNEIDATNMPGWYEFCPADNSLVVGARSIGYQLKGVTNMAPVNIRVQMGLPFNIVGGRGDSDQQYVLQAATATTAQLASAESSADDRWNGQKIIILAGTASGSYACITDFVNATDTATVDAWTGGTPSTDSTYDIVPDPVCKRVAESTVVPSVGEMGVVDMLRVIYQLMVNKKEVNKLSATSAEIKTFQGASSSSSWTTQDVSDDGTTTSYTAQETDD